MISKKLDPHTSLYYEQQPFHTMNYNELSLSKNHFFCQKYSENKFRELN